jgi:uncharacterized phage-associated protein
MEDRKAFACANYILDNLQNRGINDLTNLKLEKLLYFAYGIHISLYNEALFDEKIQAWRLGPVVPSVYREFKDFGSNPIGNHSRARMMEDFTGEITTPNLTSLDNQENAEKSLVITCVAYGNQKAWKLVDITHKEKTSAWAKVYDPNKPNQILNNNDIIKEFEPYIKTIRKHLG